MRRQRQCSKVSHRLTFSSAWPKVSLTSCWVRAANGENDALSFISWLPCGSSKLRMKLDTPNILAKSLKLIHVHVDGKME